MLKLLFRKKKKVFLLLVALFLVWFYFALPKPLFLDPLSVVIEDESGQLLSARLAKDEQWRFPMIDSVPINFSEAIIAYEDKRFESHIGVDFKSIYRAINQNFSAGKVISGASTIHMQLMRLAQKNRKRTYRQKLYETIMALRLNLAYSKKEIMRYYASYAPFGGNIVGLEAASWRYFGKSPHLLSAGEAAVLAVLPNNPSLVRPGKNEKTLLRKRNKLLDKLYELNRIDSISWVLGKEEPLPSKPQPLPSLTPHLLNFILAEKEKKQNKQTRFKTTIKKPFQQRVNRIVDLHLRRLKASEVNNCAVLILDVETGNTLAYVGNAIHTGAAHGSRVDVIQANRSTGSVLKPMLVGWTLDAGLVTEKSFLQDIPTQYGQYHPENFNHNYSGVLPMNQALIRSLNIPFVRLLKDYGVEKFHDNLRKVGFKSLTEEAGYYGLTLVVGGVETSPWQVGGSYASLARTLRHFYDNDGQYDLNDLHPAKYLAQAKKKKPMLSHNPPVMSAGAIWSTFNIMKALKRPNQEGNWQRFGTGRPIAWKTGTSLGFRDAWAMGLDRDFVVVVWTGNGNGEGRAGLTGVHMAAPILFDVFRSLPQGKWFDPPYDELIEKPVCSVSGFSASTHCPTDTLMVVNTDYDLALCRYHPQVMVDIESGLRVTRDCAKAGNMKQKQFFSLRPMEAFYYKLRHPDYTGLPPYKKGCEPNGYQSMQLIYPQKASIIYVPVGLDGTREKTIFEVAYDYPNEVLFWHLDKKFIGKTKHFHQMGLDPSEGNHVLTIVDKDGNKLVQKFEVVVRSE